MYARNQKAVNEAKQRRFSSKSDNTRLIGAILIIIGLVLVMWSVLHVKQNHVCKYQDPQLQCQ